MSAGPRRSRATSGSRCSSKRRRGAGGSASRASTSPRISRVRLRWRLAALRQRSAPGSSTSSVISSVPGTWKSRCSETALDKSCTSTSASARSSAAIRSSWRSPRRRTCRRPARRGSRARRWPAPAIGYTNAGTMEFLVDEGGGFYFLEMNARLQVEHPVTEEVTGLDLVVAQLRAAAGEPLPWGQSEIVQRRAAIECRVYAEDPSKGFLPSPGTVQRLELPSGEGIRIESGVEPGSTVSVHYDPLLLKLIAHGATRQEALERMVNALDRCVVEGLQTTIPFLRRVVASDEFKAGRVHTQLLEQGAFNA